MLLLLLQKLYEENLGYYQIKIPQKVLEIVWFDLFLTLFSKWLSVCVWGRGGDGGKIAPLPAFSL